MSVSIRKDSPCVLHMGSFFIPPSFRRPLSPSLSLPRFRVHLRLPSVKNSTWAKRVKRELVSFSLRRHPINSACTCATYVLRTPTLVQLLAKLMIDTVYVAQFAFCEPFLAFTQRTQARASNRHSLLHKAYFGMLS